MQSGTAYLMRNNEIKVPTSWSLSTDYNSEQNNYMQPSPQGKNQNKNLQSSWVYLLRSPEVIIII